MSTITPEQQNAIAEYVNTHKLSRGLGSEDSACSIAAINIALTGQLKDTVPECMSPVIGCWVIQIQDAMPHEMRNSSEWKNLLPRAAGTGREHELERLKIVTDWLYDTVLPEVQPIADESGFGAEWTQMINERTRAAAEAVVAASRAAASREAAKSAAKSAAWAAAEEAAISAAKSAAWAAEAAAEAVAEAAAEAAAEAVAWAAAWAAAEEAWQKFNPAGLLEKLISVSE